MRLLNINFDLTLQIALIRHVGRNVRILYICIQRSDVS